jgi:cellulose 1,4-beta-cellobiosidase
MRAARHAPNPAGAGKRDSRWPYRQPRFIAPTLAVALIGVGGIYAYHATFPHAAILGSAAKPVPVARLCGQAGWPEKTVAGGAYVVQNDEWNSTAPECITTDGGAQFSVVSSSIQMPTAGDPGGYPSIYSGCSAGVCTTGNKMPIQVARLQPGKVTSSWTTTQPSAGAYDVAYDIWFNHTRATSGAPNGGELMIWLAHRGGSNVAPAGNPVGHVSIGGYAYTIWVGPGGPHFQQITYVMDRTATSVRNLDISAIAADAARHGYIAETSYLLNIQAGFEIWQHGAGLDTKSFSVKIGK